MNVLTHVPSPNAATQYLKVNGDWELTGLSTIQQPFAAYTDQQHTTQPLTSYAPNVLDVLSPFTHERLNANAHI